MKNCCLIHLFIDTCNPSQFFFYWNQIKSIFFLWNSYIYDESVICFFSPCAIYTSQFQLQKCVVLKADYTWTNIYNLSIFYDRCSARHGVPISTHSVFTYKRILTFDLSKSHQYNNFNKTYAYIHHTCIYYKNFS